MIRRAKTEQEIALIDASRSGDLDRVAKLLDAGVETDVQDQSAFDCVYKSPLMWAAMGGHVEVVELLLSRGADPNGTTDGRNSEHKGFTALHLAAEKAGFSLLSARDLRDIPALIAKLASCADPVSQFLWARFSRGNRRVLTQAGPITYAKQGFLTDELNTVVLGASIYTTKRFENVDLSERTRDLLAQKPKGEDRSRLNRFLLEDAYPLEIVNSQQALVPVVKALLSAGAKVNAKSRNGETPLMQAAWAGSRDVAETLLRAGASVNERARNGGCTALEAAVSKQNLELVRLLLASGVNPNLMHAHFGSTALHDAAIKGDLEIVQALLDAGADPNFADLKGKTPLDEARRFGRQKVAKLLVHYGGRENNRKARRSAKPEPEKVVEIAIPQFEGKARRAEYQRVMELLKTMFQTEPSELQGYEHRLIVGGWSFALSQAQANKALETHHADLLQEGAYLFRHQLPRRMTDTTHGLGLLPTADKYDVIAAMETAGGNYGMSTSDIVKLVGTLESEQPLHVIGVGVNFLEVRFLPPFKDLRKIVKHCREVRAESGDRKLDRLDDTKAIRRALEKDGYLMFYWE